MKKTNNKGFSLVELIVVIAIMAVLVGVLAPQFLKYVERARKSTDVQNVASIVTALQTYAADPMVASTDALKTDGKIILTTGPVAVSATNATNNADKALTAAGITTIGLKSTKWTAAGNLTVTVATDGSVTVSDGTAADADESIIAGKYK